MKHLNLFSDSASDSGNHRESNHCVRESVISSAPSARSAMARSLIARKKPGITTPYSTESSMEMYCSFCAKFHFICQAELKW